MTSVWCQKPSDFYDFCCTKFSWNLTWAGYKIAHLTCILWPHYLEKCKKKLFSAVLFTRASECLGYYWIKWTTTVTLQLSGKSFLIAGVRSDLPLREVHHLYSVMPLFVHLTHDALLEFSPCLNQPLLQLDHIPGVHTCASCPRTVSWPQ